MRIRERLWAGLRKPAEVDTFAAQAAIARADKARQLLEDELFEEAFKAVGDVYMAAWAGSGPFDVEVRERAWIATKLLADVKNHLRAAMENGDAARKIIERDLAA